MDLILWRHAEAEEVAGLDDLGRPLTAKGERQARRVAAWLNRHIAHSTRVLASPALRCQQTASALERSFRTADALAPGATPDALLAAARWPSSGEPVLIVGHQPTLGQVAAFLVCGEAQPWSIRKGGLWWLRDRDREGAAQVVVHAVIAPDLA